ncbi:hypothetical protein Cgig2_010394 [Carnegiea gigantea]|uniref:Uncharacterized protein n=1 Tax=Carnegiea gigantea TaxID=171969 RepID=A0A9Q1K917_9CARY|nr:hypothetical protein Cgig2_010394 [Carnegiea gigantea]
MVCLDLSALNLTKLVDFDVNTLAKELNHGRVEKYRKLYDIIVYPISTPSMWENRTFPNLDAPYSQVKKGRPKEHKRRDSQPLPPAIGSTSFGSGTTKLIEKKEKKATLGGVEKKKRKANSGGDEQTKRAKANKTKSGALVITALQLNPGFSKH